MVRHILFCLGLTGSLWAMDQDEIAYVKSLFSKHEKNFKDLVHPGSRLLDNFLPAMSQSSNARSYSTFDFEGVKTISLGNYVGLIRLLPAKKVGHITIEVSSPTTLASDNLTIKIIDEKQIFMGINHPAMVSGSHAAILPGYHERWHRLSYFFGIAHLSPDEAWLSMMKTSPCVFNFAEEKWQNAHELIFRPDEMIITIYAPSDVALDAHEKFFCGGEKIVMDQFLERKQQEPGRITLEILYQDLVHARGCKIFRTSERRYLPEEEMLNYF